MNNLALRRRQQDNGHEVIGIKFDLCIRSMHLTCYGAFEVLSSTCPGFGVKVSRF